MANIAIFHLNFQRLSILHFFRIGHNEKKILFSKGFKMMIQHDESSTKYLKMYMTTSNLSAAGQKGLTERRIVEILKGRKPTEIEKIWLERGLSESSLDILTGLVWHLRIKPSQLSGLFKQCNVTRTDWDYG